MAGIVSIELTPKAILTHLPNIIEKFPAINSLRSTVKSINKHNHNNNNNSKQQLRIFIPWLPATSFTPVAESVAVVSKLGFVPVPHIVARNIQSQEHLDEILATIQQQHQQHHITSNNNGCAHSENDNDTPVLEWEALLVAGSLAEPRGPYSDSLQVLNHIITKQQHQHNSSSSSAKTIPSLLQRVYFACHPHGHPTLSTTHLHDTNLCRKIAAIDQFNSTHNARNINSSSSSSSSFMQAEVVTQIAFDMDRVYKCIRSVQNCLNKQQQKQQQPQQNHHHQYKVPVRIGVCPPISPFRLASLVSSLALIASHTPLSLSSSTLWALVQPDKQQTFINAAVESVAKNAGIGDVVGSGDGIVGLHVYGLDKASAVLSFANDLITRIETHHRHQQ